MPTVPASRDRESATETILPHIYFDRCMGKVKSRPVREKRYGPRSLVTGMRGKPCLEQGQTLVLSGTGMKSSPLDPEEKSTGQINDHPPAKWAGDRIRLIACLEGIIIEQALKKYNFMK